MEFIWTFATKVVIGLQDFISGDRENDTPHNKTVKMMKSSVVLMEYYTLSFIQFHTLFMDFKSSVFLVKFTQYKAQETFKVEGYWIFFSHKVAFLRKKHSEWNILHWITGFDCVLITVLIEYHLYFWILHVHVYMYVYLFLL